MRTGPGTMNRRYPNVFARFAAQSTILRQRLESDAALAEMSADYETALDLARTLDGRAGASSHAVAELYRSTARELEEEIASALELTVADETG